MSYYLEYPKALPSIFYLSFKVLQFVLQENIESKTSPHILTDFAKSLFTNLFVAYVSVPTRTDPIFCCSHEKNIRNPSGLERIT